MQFSFQFFVGKHSSLRGEYDSRSFVDGGFYNMAQATEFAKLIHDGRNWTYVYNVFGKVVHIISPGNSRTP